VLRAHLSDHAHYDHQPRPHPLPMLRREYSSERFGTRLLRRCDFSQYCWAITLFDQAPWIGVRASPLDTTLHGTTAPAARVVAPGRRRATPTWTGLVLRRATRVCRTPCPHEGHLCGRFHGEIPVHGGAGDPEHLRDVVPRWGSGSSTPLSAQSACRSPGRSRSPGLPPGGERHVNASRAVHDPLSCRLDLPSGEMPDLR
jgi:hypothetical protein